MIDFAEGEQVRFTGTDLSVHVPENTVGVIERRSVGDQYKVNFGEKTQFVNWWALRRHYPANTVARATVKGVPGVVVFRREFLPGHFDWTFTPVPEQGLEYTCASDPEGIVEDIEVLSNEWVRPCRNL